MSKENKIKSVDFIKAFISFVFLFVVNVFFVLSGLLFVALGIPFRVEGFSVSDGRPIVNLPKWLYPYGNDFDGLLGDKRFWYANNTPFGVPVDSFLAMYNWAALRNPCNNLRMLDMFNAKITDSTFSYLGDYIVEDDPGEGGWQFVKCVDVDGKVRYGLYVVKPYFFNPKYAFVIRWGFKVQPKDAGTVDMPKGFVTKISFWKEL